MRGLCPTCDQRQGLSPMAGRMQEFSDPKPVATSLPASIPVPEIVQGQECEHTISLRSFLEHNQKKPS
jgi:hypothetical protein